MKIGDLVSVLDDDLKGKIFALKGNHVLLEDSHGFLHEIEKEKIVPQNESLYQQINKVEKKDIVHKKSNKNNAHYTIDLHFDQLVKVPSEYNSWERLLVQKEKLIEKLEFCRAKRIRKLEIIHGIGDGVLQNMVHEVLQGFAGIEYEDHSFFYHSSGSVVVTFL